MAFNEIESHMSFGLVLGNKHTILLCICLHESSPCKEVSVRRCRFASFCYKKYSFSVTKSKQNHKCFDNRQLWFLEQNKLQHTRRIICDPLCAIKMYECTLLLSTSVK